MFKTERSKANLAGRRQLRAARRRRRRVCHIERLESRYYLSATPLVYQSNLAALLTQEQVALNGYSNATPAGAAAISDSELQWAIMQAANATNPVQPRYVALALPNDPMFPNQWHLLNLGQEVGNPDLQPLFGVPGEDINVVPVWDRGITGNGVSVAVFDTGVQSTHPDLFANIDPTLRLNATTGGTNASPSPTDPSGYHGTAVAGIIGAVGNNGIGGTGVAPNVTLVPIRRDFTNPLEEEVAFEWALENGIDITNNSWGPNHASDRAAIPLTPEELQILRSSVIFGRDNLGMIHVFSAGNNGGPDLGPGFDSFGNYDSTAYNAWANSRYTITVTGVDHDGQYRNADGTATNYPTAGPNVLVAAPTGSNGAITIANDDGYGSGIWTTDLVGDKGRNAAAKPIGFDPDQDYWPDPDYTSRFNGTSASAPMVSGVIALMLEANPNLTYRDVQTILMRSARQNAEFETPSTGALNGPRSTWQTNQIGPFRDPDRWISDSFQDPFLSIFNPLADPNNHGSFNFDFVGSNNSLDGGRQVTSHYEPQPALFTNGAGYTVSQGYGPYSEMTGYGHGVVDAELAVWMAERWDTFKQNLAPSTERTFTTSVVNFGSGLNIPAAEKMAVANSGMIVPGGLGGQSGFIDYWNEYFKSDNPADPTDGPFSQPNAPGNTRGLSYIDFAVPPAEQINVEWVEVKVDIDGPAPDLDFLRLMLTSPEGTQSELNHFWVDPGITGPSSLQPISAPGNGGDFFYRVDPDGNIDTDGGTFVWTFGVNRNWGESTNTSVIIDPVTGEPVVAEDFFGTPLGPMFRDWELHVENWSDSSFKLRGVEVVWHGKPVAGGHLDPNWHIAAAQRVQGFVGIDTNGDNNFNFRRSVQTVGDTDGDPNTTRLQDVTRKLDFTDNNHNDVFDDGDVINQEPFAAQVLVKARRVVNPGLPGEFVESNGFDFLTGADGNYYFDLDPTQTYQISIEDLSGLSQIALNDILTPSTAPPGFAYAPHYLATWRITPDWFFAPDRHNPMLPGNEPGEILWGPTDANGDGVVTAGPLPFIVNGAPVPMAVKNINFLLKSDLPANEVVIQGTVFADADGSNSVTPGDTPLSGITVYRDANLNGIFDPGEPIVVTDGVGSYSFAIPTTVVTLFSVGVFPPTADWHPSAPGGLQKFVIGGPGQTVSNVNFFLLPPALAAFDFGDAPDSYSTTLAADGARHRLNANNLTLGAQRDAEANGQTTAFATGDDLNGVIDDEDGVSIPALSPGQTAAILVNAPNGGKLNAWFDFNGNGLFEGNERAITNRSLVNGNNNVLIAVPATAFVGLTFARFRLNSSGNLGPSGEAVDGEVEDYAVIITVGASAITSFTLINAETDQPIRTIANGDVINRADLPTHKLNIRAETSGGPIESVRFGFDGDNNYRVENSVPYALFGDNGGDYEAGSLNVGNHTLSATPFSADDAAGGQGTLLSIAFSIINVAMVPEITVLGNGAIIYDGDGTPSTADNTQFDAATQGGATTSRTFTIQNEGGATLTLGSVSVPAGFTVTTQPASSVPAGGSTTFIVRLDTATSGTKSGDVSFSTNDSDENPFNFRITGTVNPATSSAVTGFTLINADTNLPIRPLVNGDVIVLNSLPTRRLNVRADTNSFPIESVRFGFDGDNNYRVESSAPYAIFGDNDGDYNSGSLALGGHVITGTPYRYDDAQGTAGASLTISITVVESMTTAMSGDYNSNGAVESGDFVLGPKMMGRSVTAHSSADGNGNGTVGPEDLGLWKVKFGGTSPGAGSAVVAAGTAVVGMGLEVDEQQNAVSLVAAFSEIQSEGVAVTSAATMSPGEQPVAPLSVNLLESKLSTLDGALSLPLSIPPAAASEQIVAQQYTAPMRSENIFESRPNRPSLRYRQFVAENSALRQETLAALLAESNDFDTPRDDEPDCDFEHDAIARDYYFETLDPTAVGVQDVVSITSKGRDSI